MNNRTKDLHHLCHQSCPSNDSLGLNECQNSFRKSLSKDQIYLLHESKFYYEIISRYQNIYD